MGSAHRCLGAWCLTRGMLPPPGKRELGTLGRVPAPTTPCLRTRRSPHVVPDQDDGRSLGIILLAMAPTGNDGSSPRDVQVRLQVHRDTAWRCSWLLGEGEISQGRHTVQKCFPPPQMPDEGVDTWDRRRLHRWAHRSISPRSNGLAHGFSDV
nr:hypothetical protein CFP56_36309 [Quercus suber]